MSILLKAILISFISMFIELDIKHIRESDFPFIYNPILPYLVIKIIAIIFILML